MAKPADCPVRYRYPFVCGLIDPSLSPIDSWRECVRDSVNVVEVRNRAADHSDTDDRMLIEQPIQRVLSKRGIVAHPDEVLERHFPGAAERPDHSGAIIRVRLPEDAEAVPEARAGRSVGTRRTRAARLPRKSVTL